MAGLFRIFLFVLSVTWCFPPTKSQNCMKFSASTCENEANPLPVSSGPSTPGLPGKRGPAGPTGPPGQKGERGIPGSTANTIHLESEVESLKQDLNVTQRKLAEAEQIIADLQVQVLSLIKRRYTIKLTSTQGSYDEVRQMCVDMGGDLIQKCLSRRVHGVTYERQVTEFVNMNLSPAAVWIGINDLEVEGRWVYHNGENFYGNRQDGEDLLYFWDHDQPQMAEDCGGIQLSSKTVHDYTCTDRFFGLCEVPV